MQAVDWIYTYVIDWIPTRVLDWIPTHVVWVVYILDVHVKVGIHEVDDRTLEALLALGRREERRVRVVVFHMSSRQ